MLHPTPPTAMLKKLDVQSAYMVRDWWSSLPESAREELLGYYHEGPIMAGVIPFDYDERISLELEDPTLEVNDFYEYLVNHEDWEFMAPSRMFHICQSHTEAAKVVEEGVLKQGFSCPLGQESGQCPMQNILDQAPGSSFVLLSTATKKA